MVAYHQLLTLCLSPSRTSLSQTVPRKPPFSLALSPFPSTCRTREKQSQKSIQQINKSEKKERKKDTKMESLIPTTISSSTSLTLLTCFSSSFSPIIKHPLKLNYSFDRKFSIKTLSAVNGGALMSNSLPQKSGMYTVGDFMTKKELLHAVKPTTTIDEALELLVENRITGFPVIDDDWKLVGLVSDYDLLALDSVSGAGVAETNMFPEADSSWKTFNEIQKLLTKTNGKVVADVMTPAPLVVRETTNLEDAARLLLETKYRRLPVVDSKGKLVGIITRGNVVRAALQIKKEIEKNSQ